VGLSSGEEPGDYLNPGTPGVLIWVLSYSGLHMGMVWHLWSSSPSA